MPIDSFGVQYALLGLLLEEPDHGYALRRRLESGLGRVWRVATSQLYLVLRRLERDGLVASSDQESAGGPRRRCYKVTARGEEAFRDWAIAPSPHLRDVRVELLAKLYFLRRLAPERIQRLLHAQEEALRRDRARASCGDAGLGEDAWIDHWTSRFREGQLDAALAWLDEVRRETSKGGGAG